MTQLGDVLGDFPDVLDWCLNNRALVRCFFGRNLILERRGCFSIWQMIALFMAQNDAVVLGVVFWVHGGCKYFVFFHQVRGRSLRPHVLSIPTSVTGGHCRGFRLAWAIVEVLGSLEWAGDVAPEVIVAILIIVYTAIVCRALKTLLAVCCTIRSRSYGSPT